MKKFFRFLGIALLLFLIYFGFTTYPKLDLISGFSAKSVASGHFLDGRDLKTIEAGDNDIKMIDLATNVIDDQSKSVQASVYGLKTRRAIYREGLGATLINDDFDENKPYLVPKRNPVSNPDLAFPYGSKATEIAILPNVDYQKLNAAVANAFDDKGLKNKRSRAILVIYKDQIIAEKYADGFNQNSRLLGWSMTKSVTATYFGILQKQGKFDINKPAPITEWQNDERKKITTNNLLQMNSGLEWEEDYGKISDATKMLFQAEDMTQSQISKKLIGKPNASWNYSSGTTNLLSGILRKQFKTHQEYLDFWYSALIDKIGMHSMIVEADMRGNYVGSSYGWATARDWSKFGILYLHQGNWNGEQLFYPSWAKYVATPTSTSKGIYGGHFWLNSAGRYPDAPRNMYSANGFQGQNVFILPSHDMVIVRLGLKEEKEGFDFNGLLKGILGSVK